MTEALKRAVDLALQLPDDQQDAIADVIQQKLAELDEEEEWDTLVSSPRSQRALKKLIAEGRKEHAAGRTEEITGEKFA